MRPNSGQNILISIQTITLLQNRIPGQQHTFANVYARLEDALDVLYHNVLQAAHRSPLEDTVIEPYQKSKGLQYTA